MPMQGKIINGKFVDLQGHVYNSIPKDAEIIDELDGLGNKVAPSNNDNGNKAKQSTAPPTPQATPPNPPRPQPAATPAPAQVPYTPTAYPKCISFEILKAIQTPSMAQVSVRAHCEGQFADAVVHYDFDVYAQAPDIDMVQFKQTALKTAHAEVIEIARKLLCEQK